MANISIYGSHNAALTIEENGKILVVIEVERFSGYKNAGIAQYKVIHNTEAVLREILFWIHHQFGFASFDTCYYANTQIVHDEVMWPMHKYIPATNYVAMLHHEAHANGTFYQSPFEKALIFSFDGGGNDGKFNIFEATRESGAVCVDKIKNPKENSDHVQYDLGFPYMIFGHYMTDIKQEFIGDGNLVYPGKLMGLASYGKVNENWLPHFIDFYKNDPDGQTYLKHIETLGNQIGIEFNASNRLSNEDAWDVAATSQRAFEECFLEYAKPHMDRLPDWPICITGGCGLNILLNTRLVEEFKRDVFIGPNPNDCGISAGMMLTAMKPAQPVDLTYAGLPILDIGMLGQYFSELPHVKRIVDNIDPEHPRFSQLESHRIVDELLSGKIVGVMRGRSEHGPRALGNRSILCDPSYPDMKNILNSKVKRREWYRPFAPVVRLEDVNKFFEWDRDSRWMSFCPVVREEWRDKLPSITHVDNTARVQTVTQYDNPWLYNLLTAMNERTGIGVLLNTSFNINGRPITTTLRDAFTLYHNSDIDALIIEDYYISKQEIV